MGMVVRGKLGLFCKSGGGRRFVEKVSNCVEAVQGAGKEDPGKNEALSYRYIGGWVESECLGRFFRLWFFEFDAGKGELTITRAGQKYFACWRNAPPC